MSTFENSQMLSRHKLSCKCLMPLQLLNMKLTVLVLCMFAVLSSIACNKMRFDYHITEGKASFYENMETDLDQNTVRYYTPAHNNVYESHKFQDFKSGKQITCLPALRQCRLRDIDRRINPDAGNVTESFVRSWNRGVNDISSKTSVVIVENYYIDREVANTKAFGAGLASFLKEFNFTLYSEKKVPSDAVIMQIDKSKGLRKKRAFNLLTILDCGDKRPKRVYGFDDGTSCNYLKLCKTSRTGLDCGNVHIQSPTYYECFICPWVTNVTKYNTEVSKCTEINL